MGVNILLFLIFQIGVEPWRRKRLVKGFEDKVMEALEKEGSAGSTLAEAQMVRKNPTDTADAIENAQVIVAEEVPPEPQLPEEDHVPPSSEVRKVDGGAEFMQEPAKTISTLENLRGKIRDMFSDRQVLVRRVDLTTAMMEGAAAGVAFVGALVLLFRPR